MDWRLIFRQHKKLWIFGGAYLGVMVIFAALSVGIKQVGSLQSYSSKLYADSQDLNTQLSQTEVQLASVSAALAAALAEDQRVKNIELQKEITSIHWAYGQAVIVYGELLDLRSNTTKTAKFDDKFSESLKLLADRNYATAGAILKQLKTDIDAEQLKIAAAFKIPENVPVNNAAPGSGYSRQQVETDIGTFMVSIVAADLNSTRVIADTASESTCGNDCPVLALGDYVARSGAFAGINGPYFCPATYPQCADKKNSFDTLLMNKNKVYFNSDNNVYSNVPAVIFQGNSARFVGHSSEWGRDTGPDSVIAAQPFLVSNGNVAFGGDGDPKKGSKGSRGFIGVTGNTVYIGFVHNATVAESARVLAKMGIQNALNLDSGGSSALWSGGYKIGPGRALPIGILLVRK
jgi:exopolysaccharide biosynthesis protein